MAVEKVSLNTLSPEVRSFLARANTVKGVWVEDPETQDRYCVVKFRQPTPDEQRAALAGMSEIGARVEASLKEQGMTVEDAEREIQQAIAEVRREKART